MNILEYFMPDEIRNNLRAAETPAQEARRLRYLVLGPVSEENWAKMENAWIDDLPWLRKEVLKQNAKKANKVLISAPPLNQMTTLGDYFKAISSKALELPKKPLMLPAPKVETLNDKRFLVVEKVL